MLVKTHLIVVSQHEEYTVKWYGSLANSNPLFKNNMPIFILISGKGRMELNTLDIPYLEKMAKSFTSPKGRGSLTSDKTYIYLKEVSGNEKQICTVIHNHIRDYAPMYDDL